MKRYAIPLAGIVTATLLLAAACTKEDNQKQPVVSKTDQGTSVAPPAEAVDERGNTLVRVINALPGGSVDIYADDIKAFVSVGYKKVTPYQEFKDNQITFKAQRSGEATTAPLAENSEMMGDGTHYTLVVLPGTADDKPILRVVSDEIKPTEEGKARVRFIHAAPNLGEVDVVAAGQKDALFDGVNFDTEAGYKDVDPVSTTLEIRPDDKPTTLARIPNTKLEAGKTYTIVVAGRGTGTKVDAITVEDDLQGSSAGAKLNQ